MDFISDETGADVFSKTLIFWTTNEAEVPTGVVVGVMVGPGSDLAEVSSNPIALISVRSSGVSAVFPEIGTLSGSLLGFENKVLSKPTS